MIVAIVVALVLRLCLHLHCICVCIGIAMLLALHLCLHLGCTCVRMLCLICIAVGDLEESAFALASACCGVRGLMLLVAIACSCTSAAVVVQL